MANPVLDRDVFAPDLSQRGAMTVSGAVQKTFLLGAICAGAAWFSWGSPYGSMLLPVSLVAGLIVALIICFKPVWAPGLSPVYAVLEGVLLGVISSFFEANMQGIVMQALGLTGGVFFAMLALYQMRLLQPTKRFTSIVIGATAGIMVFYAISWIVRIFTGSSFSIITGNGTYAILFSGVVCVVAALNLIIDFGSIEEGAEAGAPKYMEWYCAFGLLVTVVWLYLEILRLLSKLRSR